jgi:hypothetical protein
MQNLLIFYLMPIFLIFRFNLKIVSNINLIQIDPYRIIKHKISKYIIDE